MRLNKFIASATGKSRREADDLITAGRIKVDGEVATIGIKIDVNNNIVTIGKKILTLPKENTLVMLHKPVGYLSSRRSQGGDPTIYDLLPAKYHTLKTAGRLDKDSSGLILLSSDGDLIQQLTHPSYAKTKVYEIELNKPLEPLHQQMISDFGIDLPDGKSRLILEKIGGDKNWRVTMHEGRNRQIRRTFAAVGYTVIGLHRTNFGSYSLNDLSTGQWTLIEKH
jgi:23S rRNA pseudouridine2605 synthase